MSSATEQEHRDRLEIAAARTSEPTLEELGTFNLGVELSETVSSINLEQILKQLVINPVVTEAAVALLTAYAASITPGLSGENTISEYTVILNTLPKRDLNESEYKWLEVLGNFCSRFGELNREQKYVILVQLKHRPAKIASVLAFAWLSI